MRVVREMFADFTYNQANPCPKSSANWSGQQLFTIQTKIRMISVKVYKNVSTNQKMRGWCIVNDQEYSLCSLFLSFFHVISQFHVVSHFSNRKARVQHKRVTKGQRRDGLSRNDSLHFTYSFAYMIGERVFEMRRTISCQANPRMEQCHRRERKKGGGKHRGNDYS